MDLQTLRTRQAWTLNQKIDHSLGVVEAFNSHFNGQVFVSFSGGKDSCVMLSLVEIILPQVPCVFIMTGCESPSVCRFIREQQQHHNIEIIRPKKTLKQVFAEYGFPLVSKEVSHDVSAFHRNPYCKSSRNKVWLGNPHHIPERWMYLINEPYEVSERCCFWLKKQPSHDYIHRTGRHPYLGLLASEGYTRQTAYISRGGCNSFREDGKQIATSWPLAIWTEQDVWQYINERRLAIPDIYAKGATRTGCMCCGFGAHKSTEGLEVMRREWPRWYNLIMNYENNGTTYREALRTMLAKVGQRLPDDHDPQTD